MKFKNNIKKLISISAVIAVLLSSVGAAATVSAQSIASLTDDFSNPSYTSDLWYGVDSETKVQSSVTAQNGKLKIASGVKTVTAVKDSAWDKMTLSEHRKLDKFKSYVTPKLGGELNIASPVLYYNSDTGDYVYLLLYKHNNYGWQISWGVNGSGRKNNNFLYTGQSFLKEATNMIIEAEYNYSDSGVLSSINVIVYYYKNNSFADAYKIGAATNILTFTGADSNNDLVKQGIERSSVEAVVNRFKAGFKGGSDESVTAMTEISKVEFNFTATVDEQALAFRNKYSSLLGKTEENISESDLAEINKALEEYGFLPENVKTELLNQYNTILSLKSAVYKQEFGDRYSVKNSVFDDFENHSDKSLSYVYSFVPTEKTASKTNNAQIVTVNGNKMLAPFVGTDGYTAVDDALWINRTLESYSFDMLVPKSAVGSSGSQLIYTYYDTKADTGIGFDIYRETRNGENGLLARISFDSAYFDISKGSRNLFLSEKSGWKLDEIIHVNASYILTDSQHLRAIIELSQGANSFKYDFDFTAKGDYEYQQQGFKTGFSCGLEKGRCYFDNLAFKFSLSGEDKAEAFKEKYKNGILSKSPSDILSESDKNELVNALTELSKLDYEVQTLLINERNLLAELAKKVDPTIESYLDKYNGLLNTDLSSLDRSYDEITDNAIFDYQSLSELGKLLVSWNTLYKIKSTLRNMLETVGANYSEQIIDFEYDYFPFVEDRNSNITKNSFCGVIDDPTDETGNNKILKIQADKNDIIEYALDSRIWPTKAQLKTLKFRMYYDGTPNAFALPGFLYSYVDEETYYSLGVSGGGAGKSRYKYNLLSGGEDLGQKWLSSPDEADLDGWLEVSLTFGKSNVSGAVKNLKSEKIVALNMPYIAGAKIGFRAYSSWNNLSRPFYLDDIKMTFERGDFDADETIEGINVYYSSNTFMKENETLLISGESIGNIADKVYLYRVNDEASSNPAYVSAGNFETKQVGKPVITNGTDYNFNSSGAKELDIIQRTKTSIKVLIPKNLASADGKTGNGIYAVKIEAKNGSSETILINVPQISFVTGDEGGISTVGSQLEIVGYNLCPTGNASDVKVVAKNTSNGALKTLAVTSIKSNDMFYLKTSLEGLSKGTYEVFVNNGYGDALCWSAPYELVIGDSPRAKWPKKVFKVEDFGAVADADTNSTAAVINALDAAYKNGGGIVEFGEGVYRVETTLPIPLNTVLKGQGSGYTTVLFTAYKWQYGEAEDLLSIIGNCSVEGINFAATRAKKFVITNKSVSANDRLSGAKYGSLENDNIYFTDVKIKSLWREGKVTDGGGGFSDAGKFTVAELLAILQTENGSGEGTIGYNSTNVRINDLELYRDVGMGHYSISGDYLYIDGIKSNVWNTYHGHNAFVTDLDARGASSIQGSHTYFGNNYMHNTTQNNRELFTTDGGPKAIDVKVRYIGNDPELMEYYTGSKTLNSKTFLLVSNSPNDNAWQNYKILVTEGQGMGQMREIVSNKNYTSVEYEFDIETGKIVRDSSGKPVAKKYKTDSSGRLLTDPETGNPIPSEDGTGKTRTVTYTCITVDTDFIANPNRNSNCYIIDDRDNTIMSNCRFEDGNAGAIYGSGVNWTFENNSFDRCAGPALTNRAGIIWYVTFNGLKMTNPQSYVHGEGHGGTSGSYQTGNGALRVYAQTSPCSFGMAGVVIKNNNMGGYRINVTQGSIANCLWDLVIENNTIDGAKNAIDGIGAAINGCFIRGNSFDVKEAAFTSTALMDSVNKVYTYNTQRSPRIIVWLNSDGTATAALGDANGDGTISLKDVTFMRYYYHGLVGASSEQQKQMDVNQDGKVDIKDINQVRKYILEGIPFEKYDPSSDSSSDSSSSSIPAGSDTSSDSSDTSNSLDSSDSSVSSDSSSFPVFPGIY